MYSDDSSESPFSSRSFSTDRSYSDEVSSDFEEQMYSQIYHIQRTDEEESSLENPKSVSLDHNSKTTIKLNGAFRRSDSEQKDSGTTLKLNRGYPVSGCEQKDKTSFNSYLNGHKRASDSQEFPKLKNHERDLSDQTDEESDLSDQTDEESDLCDQAGDESDLSDQAGDESYLNDETDEEIDLNDYVCNDIASDQSSDSLICIDSWGSADGQLMLNTTSNGKSNFPSPDPISSSCESLEIIDEIISKKYDDSLFAPITIEENSSDDDPIEILPKKPKVQQKPKLEEPQTETNDVWKVDFTDCLRGKRYFANSTKTCKKCRQNGHSSEHCMEKRVLHCLVCGELHRVVQCKNKVCGVCFTPGHTRKKCIRKHQSLSCDICNCFGHCRERCPDLWRRYHMTTSETQIVPCPKMNRNDDLNTYCYNCGIRGHLGHVCNSPRTPTNRLPSSPYVISYKNPLQDNLVNGDLEENVEESTSYGEYSTPTTSRRGRRRKRRLNELQFNVEDSASNTPMPSSSKKKQRKKKWYKKKYGNWNVE